MKYLFGEKPTTLNIALTILGFVLGIVFTWFTLEIDLIPKIIASIVVGDIFAGAYSNLTISTNTIYYNKYQASKLFSPLIFTASHLIHLAILMALTSFSIVIVFDFIVLLVLSIFKFDYKYNTLIILVSLLPGFVGFDIYGLFFSGVVVMFAVKAIAGYKFGMYRIKKRMELKV